MGGGGSKSKDRTFASEVTADLTNVKKCSATCDETMEQINLEIENCPHAAISFSQVCNASAACSTGGIDMLGKIDDVVKSLGSQQTAQLQQILRRENKKDTQKDVSLSVKTYLQQECSSNSASNQVQKNNSVRMTCAAASANPFVLPGTIAPDGTLSGPSWTFAQKATASARCMTSAAAKIADEMHKDADATPPRAAAPETLGADEVAKRARQARVREGVGAGGVLIIGILVVSLTYYFRRKK